MFHDISAGQEFQSLEQQRPQLLNATTYVPKLFSRAGASSDVTTTAATAGTATTTTTHAYLRKGSMLAIAASKGEYL